MFDSHDDDLWEVPSIDVSVPAEAAAAVEAPAAEAVAPAPEPAAAAPVEEIPPQPLDPAAGAVYGLSDLLPVCQLCTGKSAEGGFSESFPQL